MTAEQWEQFERETRTPAFAAAAKEAWLNSRGDEESFERYLPKAAAMLKDR
jgi:hypothetical protein